jgi:hypothetical protein
VLPIPFSWSIDQPGQSDAAGQPALDRGLDQRRRKASEIVMLTWRGLQSSRSAISVTPLTAPVSI